MQVELKMDDVTIILGNKGIVLKIYDTDSRHVGNLRVGKATVIWMKGKTQEANGKKIKLEKLIEKLDEA
jgi:uncharacterized membrane protein YcaP (DUF421 family)